MTIVYIPGEDNTVANTLSRVPAGAFPGEDVDNVMLGINVTLTITVDPSVLRSIQEGYTKDDFCQKVITTAPTTLGVSTSNGLWYIGCLSLVLEPCKKTYFALYMTLAKHCGMDKCYVTLCDPYYWPNMRQDLEKAYIPSCADCLCNKLTTQKPMGLLHSLPIPDD